MGSKNYWLGPAAAIALFSLSPQTGWSMEISDHLRIDGFGTQGYLRTTDNNFLGADSRGTFDFSAYSLVLKANVTDQFTVWSELSTSSQMRDAISLEWAFAQYNFNDSLNVKFGKMHTPVGIYNEVRNVFPIIPLSILPAFYADTTEFSPATIKGAALNGRFSLGGWGAEYDLYGGMSYFNHSAGSRPFENMAGTRLWINSPESVLRIGQTLFTGVEMLTDAAGLKTGGRTRMTTYIPSFEYFSPIGLTLRGELGLHYHQGELKNPKDPRRLGYYVEATYALTEKLTPVVRYDVYYPRRRAVDFPKDYQQDLTFGFNYGFASYFVWKAEIHHIKGTTLLDPATNPAPKTRWNLMATSVSFLF